MNSIIKFAKVAMFGAIIVFVLNRFKTKQK